MGHEPSVKDEKCQMILDSIMKVVMDEPEMKKLIDDLELEIFLYGRISDAEIELRLKEAFKKLK